MNFMSLNRVNNEIFFNRIELTSFRTILILYLSLKKKYAVILIWYFFIFNAIGTDINVLDIW